MKVLRGARVFRIFQRDRFSGDVVAGRFFYIHVVKDKRFPLYREKGEKKTNPNPQKLTDAVLGEGGGESLSCIQLAET